MSLFKTEEHWRLWRALNSPMKTPKNTASAITIVTHVRFDFSYIFLFSTSLKHSPYSGLSAVEFAVSAQ